MPTRSTPRGRAKQIVAGLLLAIVSALNCGRDVTAPYAAGSRMARGLSFQALFPASLSRAGSLASQLVPFDRVRVRFLHADSSTALDTIVSFPSTADSIALSFDVPIASVAPSSGERDALTLGYINAGGDTVFRGGPVPLTVTPIAGLAPAAVRVPIRYTGAGASALGVRITPKHSGVFAGDGFQFAAAAFDSLGQPIAAPVLFRSLDESLAFVPAPTSGAGSAGAARGEVGVVAQLLTGQADTAWLDISPLASALQLSSGGGQQGASGAPLPQVVAARVVATDGGGVPGIAVSFAASAGGRVGATTVTTDANGIAQTTWTLGPAIGAQTLTVTAGALIGSPLSVSATAAGPPTHLKFTTQPANGVAGSPLASVVVSALSASNAVVTNYTGSISIALASAPHGALLGGTATVAAVGGVATFAGLSLTKAGSETLVATAAALAPDSSSAFIIAAAPASSLAIADGDHQTGTVSTRLGAPLLARVTDAFGNPVSGTSVSFSVGAGSGSVSPATAKTDSSGLAGASWTLGSDFGPQTVTATAAGLKGSPLTFSATGTHGVATRLSVARHPSNAHAGEHISSIVVNAVDGFGELQDSFNGKITLSFWRNGRGGTLMGTTTVTAVGGVATFSDIWIAKAADGYRLAVTADGLTQDTTLAFTISPAAAARLAVARGDAQSSVVASRLQNKLGAAAFDAYDNPVPGVVVNWAVVSGGGRVDNATSVTDTSGVAENAWTLGTVAGAHRLRAASDGLSGAAADFSASAAPGTAVKLSIVGQPGDVAAGERFSSALQVEARDQWGNAQPAFGGAVTLSFAANPGGATMSGSSTTNASSGESNFPDLSFDKAASGYRLVATAEGLARDTSTAFAVRPAAAAALGIANGNGQHGKKNSQLPSPLTVRVTDRFGNAVGGAQVTWSVTGGSGTVASSATATDSSGVAANHWSLGKEVGSSHRVTAQLPGAAGAVIFAATADP